MKILVCIKQTPDTETKIKINSQGSGIDEAGVKWIMNPYDEFAVEEALKLKEAKAGSTVTVMSLGPKKRVTDSLRTALAMGADDAIVIDSDLNLDSFSTAKGLAAAVEQEGPFDIIFTGKLAIDDNAASVSQILAAFTNSPHTTVVSKFEASDGHYVVEREVEGGTREIVQLNGTAVVGANKGLNTPRYASLPGIMKAKKKPLKELELSALGVSEGDLRVKFSDFQLPPEKPPVKMVESAGDLAKLLHEEAKVL